MNYFEAISYRAEELNCLGDQYLEHLPWLDNNEVRQRIWECASKIDQSEQENPDWVDSTMDGHIPFGSIPRNGSIYFSLGFALAANDARLRNLLEIAEGRETEELTFPNLAEKDKVEALLP